VKSQSVLRLAVATIVTSQQWLGCGKPYLEQEQTSGLPEEKVARWSR